MTPEFLAAVKAGRIEGLAHKDDLKHGELLWVDDAIPCFLRNGLDLEDTLILCHHLRDWFTALYWDWCLTSTGLTIFKPIWHTGEDVPEEKHLVSIQDGSPLDWHISAAMHVLACEEGQG
jgi:hypothetical protein